jgi:hypothetical protein
MARRVWEWVPFRPGRQSQGELDQAPGPFVQRTGFRTGFTESGIGFPDVGKALGDTGGADGQIGRGTAVRSGAWDGSSDAIGLLMVMHILQLSSRIARRPTIKIRIPVRDLAFVRSWPQVCQIPGKLTGLSPIHAIQPP